jgi:NADPH:quinone reductase-like Zn-dependent oxidoreductase
MPLLGGNPMGENSASHAGALSRLMRAVFGVTNSRFTGAYAECAVAEAAMIARKPRRLSCVEAASAPVVATTAWQMVFEHGQTDVQLPPDRCN